MATRMACSAICERWQRDVATRFGICLVVTVPTRGRRMNTVWKVGRRMPVSVEPEWLYVPWHLATSGIAHFMTKRTAKILALLVEQRARALA